MQHSSTSVIAAASMAALLSLAGCGERSDDTAADTTTTRPRAGEVASTTRTTTPAARSAGSDTASSVMGAARDAREPAYGTDPTTAPGSGAGSDRSRAEDSRLTSMVLKGLKADKELNPLRIDVDAVDGVVTLSGAVPTAAARARAGEIARNVKEVRSVNDQLTVSGG